MDKSESLYNYLLADRLQNYGYSAKDFRRIQAQRQRVKARFRRYKVGLAERAEGESRLSYTEEHGWEYTVGQSANEEITNLMARLCEYPGKKWLS